MYQDTDFNPQSEEERQQAERDEELARRIRREVRRVQSGEADADMEADREREEAEEADREEREERRRRRAASPLRGLVTGNVLRQEWLTGNYRYPLLIAGVFLLSIFVMFWALRLDMNYTRTEREVQLLREKAIRLREQRGRLTTHSAIVERLRTRNIPLRDPLSPHEKIED